MIEEPSFDIPPRKKKLYPYRLVKVFDLTTKDSPRYRSGFKEACWNCGNQKDIFREAEFVYVLGYQQVTINFGGYECSGCGLPESLRLSVDWPNKADIFSHDKDIRFKGPFQRKWDNRKKHLIKEAQDLEARLSRLKKTIASI